MDKATIEHPVMLSERHVVFGKHSAASYPILLLCFRGQISSWKIEGHSSSSASASNTLSFFCAASALSCAAVAAIAACTLSDIVTTRSSSLQLR